MYPCNDYLNTGCTTTYVRMLSPVISLFVHMYIVIRYSLIDHHVLCVIRMWCSGQWVDSTTPCCVTEWLTRLCENKLTSSFGWCISFPWGVVLESVNWHTNTFGCILPHCEPTCVLWFAAAVIRRCHWVVKETYSLYSLVIVPTMMWWWLEVHPMTCSISFTCADFLKWQSQERWPTFLWRYIHKFA